MSYIVDGLEKILFILKKLNHFKDEKIISGQEIGNRKNDILNILEIENRIKSFKLKIKKGISYKDDEIREVLIKLHFLLSSYVTSLENLQLTLKKTTGNYHKY